MRGSSSREQIRTWLEDWPVEDLRELPPSVVATCLDLREQTDVASAKVWPGKAAGSFWLCLICPDSLGLAQLTTGTLVEVEANIVRGSIVFPRRPSNPVDGVSGPRHGYCPTWRQAYLRGVRCGLKGAWRTSAAISTTLGADLLQKNVVFEERVPLEIELNNHAHPEFTILNLWTSDTPGFLYAFTQGLSLRGVYVHGVRIRTEGERVRDRFLISDRHGRKIVTDEARAEAEVLAVLIKSFSHFLSRAADPAHAVVQF